MDTQDKIIEKLVEMDQKLNSLEDIKEDLRSFKEETAVNFDHQGAILRRLDQERLFTMEHIKRIEAEVDRIKAHLHLA